MMQGIKRRKWRRRYVLYENLSHAFAAFVPLICYAKSVKISIASI